MFNSHNNLPVLVNVFDAASAEARVKERSLGLSWTTTHSTNVCIQGEHYLELRRRMCDNSGILSLRLLTAV